MHWDVILSDRKICHGGNGKAFSHALSKSLLTTFSFISAAENGSLSSHK